MSMLTESRRVKSFVDADAGEIAFTLRTAAETVSVGCSR